MQFSNAGRKVFPRGGRLGVHIQVRVRMGRLWLSDVGQSCVEIWW